VTRKGGGSSGNEIEGGKERGRNKRRLETKGEQKMSERGSRGHEEEQKLII